MFFVNHNPKNQAKFLSAQHNTQWTRHRCQHKAPADKQLHHQELTQKEQST